MVDHSTFTFTPLHWAASQGRTEVVLKLIAAGADADILSAGKTPLELAKRRDHLETAEALSACIARLESDPSHSETERQNQLFQAAKAGDLRLIRELLADGADVNQRDDEGQMLLNVAVLGTGPNQTDIMLELIALGADVNAKDSFGQTAVHKAVSDMLSTSSLEALISAGSNVNLWDNAFNTPLHWATACSKEAVVMLLENGAIVDVRNSMGSTPLHEAAFYGEAESVAALIAAGADIDARNMWGEAPLHRAAGWGNLATVQTLIDSGGNIHAVHGSTRATPLHEAATHGKTAIALALINAGADVEARTKQGQTPLAIAVDKCHTETALAIGAEGDR